ncbi:sulfotransferase domain-containing protein [Rhodovulum sp. FJ3]|uniref:sulfotransferase domain-containing protein n=1 Tax=Rhodovulum sp. FJ3 TaxID=3079053 RepID=UPI00293DB95A|nr:sulfotransferase domain-containing protein [Rhodovulum sp. FJ3]MDV4166752.1 sulfotransferase domain-containing protein [Rhodovulum sp. FJ3]
MQVNRPDFVIPGAMKAGTTAVADILAEIPGIGFSVPKEPGFLMRHDYEQENPGSVPFTPDRLDDLYSACFRAAPVGALTGEATVAYFTDETSPEILVARNPEVKAIILLRDPAKRAFSGYSYCRSIYFEPAETLDAALAQELEGARDRFWPTLRHMHYSDYPQHLRRWKTQLKAGHLLILEFEDFIANPKDGIDRICAFLGIEAPEVLPTKERSNVTVVLDSPLKRAVMKILHSRNGLKSIVKPLLPGRFREKLKVRIQDRLAAGQEKPEPMSAWCKETLNARFAGMQTVLAEEFDFHPQHWTSGK